MNSRDSWHRSTTNSAPNVAKRNEARRHRARRDNPKTRHRALHAGSHQRRHDLQDERRYVSSYRHSVTSGTAAATDHTTRSLLFRTGVTQTVQRGESVTKDTAVLHPALDQDSTLAFNSVPAGAIKGRSEGDYRRTMGHYHFSRAHTSFSTPWEGTEECAQMDP